ncbi:MAG: hypothetical protein ACTHLE_04200 [Agriterribacter sp.]
MKKVKAILFAALLISLAFLAVMGWHFTDEAKTPFWWNGWVVIAIVSAIAFIALILWFTKTNQKL